MAKSKLSVGSIRIEENIPVQSIPIQVSMSNLISRRDWKKVEQDSLQLRSRVFSALNLLEGEYQDDLSQREELCASMIEKKNQMIR